LDILKSRVKSLHDGLELVLELGRSRLLGDMGSIIIIEELRDWEESVLVGRRGATRVTWAGRDCVGSRWATSNAMTGTVGHCCKAVGGYLLFGSIFVLAGRCGNSRGRTNDGSCRAGRGSCSCWA
jgi:hypothetical protein